MKVDVVAAVERVSGRLESMYRRGCVRVVLIRCNLCRDWVDPSDWDPQKAVCEACAIFVVRPTVKPRRPKRVSRSGGAR